ncbi:hypothetical protein [Streptomyces buecherae]|uniref:Protein kinase family protein n=1 Tax=Streptomyces buecherae TaxID=2763006 RepID=A0A7H8NIM1_9ACTN|nr:hypothetical protein [Streptomyces buecherae]QKW54176.1 hypothetical protein HUT08_02180 [Streptomyces buecherae]
MRRRHPAERRAARVSAWRSVGAALARLGDRRIADLLAGATPLGSGIGGRSAVLEVAGVPVFVKRVPLTERELRPEHARSTANLFGLPTWYQYGVGSAGFGAWRELATHTLTTRWVLADACQGFPLTYHWRVLPDTPPEGFVAEFGGIDGAVAHWEGSPAVRARLEAIGRAPASLVLFLEYVPHTLAGWLADLRDGGEYRRFLRGWLAGRPRPVVGAARGALVDRHARGALLLHDFHHDLLTVSKRTPFPAERLRREVPTS